MLLSACVEVIYGSGEKDVSFFCCCKSPWVVRTGPQYLEHFPNRWTLTAQSADSLALGVCVCVCGEERLNEHVLR